MTVSLELAALTVRFGGLVALRDVSFTVDEGESVGLIGPNGAGKTTLIDAVTGFTRYDGSVVASGVRVDGLRPDQRAARGLTRTFQSLELFEELSVHENLSIGAQDSHPRIAAALTAVGLEPFADRLPATLPPSMRRSVALARAVAAEPRVLLLDEIAAGLDRSERSAMTQRLRDVVASGTSLLLVDHDLGFVANLCRRIIVLGTGKVIASGSPADVRRDERVLAAYLGPGR